MWMIMCIGVVEQVSKEKNQASGCCSYPGCYHCVISPAESGVFESEQSTRRAVIYELGSGSETYPGG